MTFTALAADGWRIIAQGRSWIASTGDTRRSIYAEHRWSGDRRTGTLFVNRYDQPLYRLHPERTPA